MKDRGISARTLSAAASSVRAGRRTSAAILRQLLGCASSLLALTMAPLAGGEFRASERISLPSVPASQPDLAAAGPTALVTFVEGDSVVLVVPETGDRAPVAESRSGVHRPRLAASPLGRVTVAFAAPSGPGLGTGLWLSERATGSFGPALELASGLAIEPRHRVGYDLRAAPLLVWEAAAGEAAPMLRILRGGIPEDLAAGEQPDLRVDSRGFVHVSYLRDSVARYRTDRWDGDLSTEVDVTGSDGAAALCMVVDSQGYPHWILELPLGLYHVRRQAEVSPPRLVAQGGSAPRASLSPDGWLGVSFLREGSLWFTRAQEADPIFAPASRIDAVDGPSPCHALVADSLGGFHVTFESSGEVRYTNDIAPPEPDFEPSAWRVVQGEAVTFRDLSRGRIARRLWDFGDGTTSTDATPTHRYASAGRFRPSLRVAGPGGESALVSSQELEVTRAENLVRCAAVAARPGDSGILVPVLLTSAVGIFGYQVTLDSSPEVQIQGIAPEGTAMALLRAEFVREILSSGAQGPRLTVGVLWDYNVPLDGRVLPPVDGRALVRVKCDLAADAVPTTTAALRFIVNAGVEGEGTFLVSAPDSLTVVPSVLDCGIRVGSALDSPFLRGDANRDGVLDISDGVFVLAHLFLGEEAPSCADSADSNDDGAVDISDAIETLQVLFLDPGRFPPYPYPTAGLDPTPDDLTVCE